MSSYIELELLINRANVLYNALSEEKRQLMALNEQLAAENKKLSLKVKQQAKIIQDLKRQLRDETGLLQLRTKEKEALKSEIDRVLQLIDVCLVQLERPG